jgi:hypothetical protein
VSVRNALRSLERRMERTHGGPRSPCRCDGPLMVIYNEMKGTRQPERVEAGCTRCGRTRVRINLRIVPMPLPDRPREGDKRAVPQGKATSPP